MRKTLFVLLCLVLFLGIVGCGDNQSSSSSTDKKSLAWVLAKDDVRKN